MLTSLIILRFVSTFCFYSCCCKAVQVSLNSRQSVILQKTYLTKPTSSFHFCFLFVWINVTFFLYQHSKSKEKSENTLILYSMYLFYQNYTAFWKSNPREINKKTHFFFTFLTLNFSYYFWSIICNKFSRHEIFATVLWAAA